MCSLVYVLSAAAVCTQTRHSNITVRPPVTRQSLIFSYLQMLKDKSKKIWQRIRKDSHLISQSEFDEILLNQIPDPWWKEQSFKVRECRDGPPVSVFLKVYKDTDAAYLWSYRLIFYTFKFNWTELSWKYFNWCDCWTLLNIISNHHWPLCVCVCVCSNCVSLELLALMYLPLTSSTHTSEMEERRARTWIRVAASHGCCGFWWWRGGRRAEGDSDDIFRSRQVRQEGREDRWRERLKAASEQLQYGLISKSSCL